ncbi:MAG: class I SAM-dependent methyltransferase [Ardenticatenaceae bacterium]|nr:class I SAM-dependent methyltransferase [Ardenticatenaceae bacterium]MCB9443850.1 class I SAM-dependent methyltransferase [Ardenticatenaceae bacterium]
MDEVQRYDRGMWLLENYGLKRLRRMLLQEVRGEVLEIGVGTGANLPFYNGNVGRLTAVDINPARLVGTMNRAQAVNGRHPIQIGAADAQQLPFPDDQFDTVVGTLVFCSIPEPMAALAEIKRVLRVNGRFLLLEHVRGLNPITQRLTDWLHPAWFAMQGSCHLNRETAVTVQAAGFHIEETSSHGWGVIQMIKASA